MLSIEAFKVAVSAPPTDYERVSRLPTLRLSRYRIQGSATGFRCPFRLNSGFPA